MKLLHNRCFSLCVFLTVGGLSAGCGGKMVTTSVQDSNLVPGSTIAQKVAPTEALKSVPSPERKAPLREEMGFGKPGAMAEARVAERAVPSVTAPATPAEAASTPALAGLSDVFFDYDRATVRTDAKAVLEANARFLKGEKGWHLSIAGHCDERGTLAYNLVLGERRAQATKRYLADLGIPAAQIQVTSYGKEKPFCTEHSKECWQKNRRAHFQVP
ncbi:MAG: OmpA family protein [Nitrospirae bacterium]|nr:OmpA family protein [Nitrospirota bacterium]